MLWHDIVIGLAIHLNVSFHPIQDESNEACFITGDPIGLCKGREAGTISFAIGLMAGIAIGNVGERTSSEIGGLKIVSNGIGGSDMAQLFACFHSRQLGVPKQSFVACKSNPPDGSMLGFTHIQRAIRSYRNAHRAKYSIPCSHNGVYPGKSISEYFCGTTGLPILKRNEADDVARLGIGRTVRGAVEGDESTVSITFRKLISPVA